MFSTGPDPRLSKKRTEALALKFFVIGFFFLPFVWLHSIFYFRRSLFHPDVTQRAKLFVILSAILFVIECFILCTWTLVYTLEWNAWGVFGENISLLVPRG